jgi:galactoside O-acetyltransferase
MENSFLALEDVKKIGFKKVGVNVFISRFASFYDSENMEIGDYVRIDDFCILSGKIKLGNYIHISAHSSIYGMFGVEMEDYTGLSPKCSIFSASDDFSGNFMIGPLIDPHFRNLEGGKILIKKYSQIGCNCIVMPAVTISEGVVVGALSMVVNDLKSWKVYGGVPTHYIKNRSKKILKFGL